MKENKDKKENKKDKEDKVFYKPELDKSAERVLWDEGLFVWDTSAIGSMYSLSPDSREQFLDVLEVLEDRIWIPARVMKEYDRHQEELIYQPVTEHYKNPEFLSTHYLKKLEDFISKAKDNEFYHPCFEKDYLDEMDSLYEKAIKILDKIRVKTEKALKAGRDKIIDKAKTDSIHDLFEGLPSGVPFTATEIMDIVLEGDIRYEHQIPPGYMDKDEKISIDRFGDLIIWKEILNHSKECQKPIIFICNDVKEDWNAGNARKGEMIPREELVEEFKSYTGQEVWFYTLNDFISKLMTHYSSHKVLKEKFKNFSLILKELELADLPDDEIKVMCENCGEITSYDSDEFWWDWEPVSSEERGMGSEQCFECHEENSVNCNQCDVCLKDFKDEAAIKNTLQIIKNLLEDGKQHPLAELNRLPVSRKSLGEALEELLRKEQIVSDGPFIAIDK